MFWNTPSLLLHFRFSQSTSKWLNIPGRALWPNLFRLENSTVIFMYFTVWFFHSFKWKNQLNNQFNCQNQLNKIKQWLSLRTVKNCTMIDISLENLSEMGFKKGKQFLFLCMLWRFQLQNPCSVQQTVMTVWNHKERKWVSVVSTKSVVKKQNIYRKQTFKKINTSTASFDFRHLKIFYFNE